MLSKPIYSTNSNTTIFIVATSRIWLATWIYSFFEAGEKYIGGNFVFSDPPNRLIFRPIDTELDEMKDESNEIAEGVNRLYNLFINLCRI